MLDGIVSFEKDTESNETSLVAVTAPEDLPSDPGARSFKLNDMLWNRVVQFMQSRTLKLTVPLNAEGMN